MFLIEQTESPSRMPELLPPTHRQRTSNTPYPRNLQSNGDVALHTALLHTSNSERPSARHAQILLKPGCVNITALKLTPRTHLQCCVSGRTGLGFLRQANPEGLKKVSRCVAATNAPNMKMIEIMLASNVGKRAPPPRLIPGKKLATVDSGSRPICCKWAGRFPCSLYPSPQNARPQ